MFLRDLNLDWAQVDENEKSRLNEELQACMAWSRDKDGAFRAETWFKVGPLVDQTDARCHGILYLIWYRNVKYSSKVGWRMSLRACRSVSSCRPSRRGWKRL